MDAQTTLRATIARVLDIVAGVMALTGGVVMGLVVAVGMGFLSQAPKDTPLAGWLPMAVFGPLALMLVGSATLSIAGGIAALKRSSWGWSVAGAAAALVAFIPLGVAALVLTIMAESEFQRPSKEPPPVVPAGG